MNFASIDNFTCFDFSKLLKDVNRLIEQSGLLTIIFKHFKKSLSDFIRHIFLQNVLAVKKTSGWETFFFEWW